VWKRHVAPLLGGSQLRQLRPSVIDAYASDLHAAGVGDATIRKALGMLQGMMRRAVVWGYISSNPVPDVTKPQRRRERAVQAIPPATVEALRARLRPRDAALVSVPAYAGLRPSEALALEWSDVGERTLLIDKALVLGETGATKTRRNRTVPLLRPLASDLAAWKLASGGRSALVFPMSDGRPFSDSCYRNWRAREFGPAAEAIGLDALRPYDLRHSFASLLLAEQRNPAEVAEALGHSLQTLFSTYAHVLNELRGQPRQTAESIIRKARAKAA
jgi:integrase